MAAGSGTDASAHSGGSGDSGSDAAYFVHGGLGSGSNAGKALFSALRRKSLSSPRPCASGAISGAIEAMTPTKKRSVCQMLSEAIEALTPKKNRISAPSQGPPSARPASYKPEMLLSEAREIGRSWLRARECAFAARTRRWVAEWAMAEYPQHCQTADLMAAFARRARRYGRLADEGVYGAAAPAGEGELPARGGQLRPAPSQGSQGCATTMVKPCKRRRMVGSGGVGVMKQMSLAEELFAWFVDTLQNIKGRLVACMLIQQANLIASDLKAIHAEKVEAGISAPGKDLDLPTVDYCWLRRWRRRFGITARLVNLRFKAPRQVLKTRLRVFWCNCLRVRFLQRMLEPGGELIFEGFDQKPLWFTASSQDKTFALKGARKVAVKENMPMTRARFTAMTRCRWPSAPEDGKEIAVLFKAKGGGSRIRENLRVPPGVLLQFQEKGSYRLPDVLTYLSWILDRSRLQPPGPQQGPSAPSPVVPGPSPCAAAAAAPASPCAAAAAAPESPAAAPAPLSPAAAAAPCSPCAAAAQPASPCAAAADPSPGGGREKLRKVFGRRVVYLLDWFAPHLDESLDAMVRAVGHAILRIGGHLTGMVQVEDTHAHGPMTKHYKKRESLEALEQLQIRPDRLPSTTRQTVLDRALDSWNAVDHGNCSQGFVSNGIANSLDGSEDHLLSLDVQPFWDDLDMPRLRAKIEEEVAEAIRSGAVTCFADYEKLLEDYPHHAAMQEGQEAFAPVVVDGDAIVHERTDSDDEEEEDADDEASDGGGGGDEPPPPPPASSGGSAEPPAGKPPLPPPPDAADSSEDQGGDPFDGGDEWDDMGGGGGAGQSAPSQAPAEGPSPKAGLHPLISEAREKARQPLLKQREAVAGALRSAASTGGDRQLEDSLRARLRATDKQLLRLEEPTAIHLRAKALERQKVVDKARKEAKAEDAKQKELKLLVELKKHEAEIAKAASKAQAAEANKALAEAKRSKEEAARLRAQADEREAALRLHFAAALAGQMEEYMRLSPTGVGATRRERCHLRCMKQARRKVGMQLHEVPRFWKPTVVQLANLRPGGPHGGSRRLRAKEEQLYCSAEFSWVLFGKQDYGSEGKWCLGNEPRYAFRMLVERLMPGYFDVLGARYSVDNLLAECHCILDLAFLAAAWRYTHVVEQKNYRCGLSQWPPEQDWWLARLEACAASGSAPSQGAAAPSIADSSSVELASAAADPCASSAGLPITGAGSGQGAQCQAAASKPGAPAEVAWDHDGPSCAASGSAPSQAAAAAST